MNDIAKHLPATRNFSYFYVSLFDLEFVRVE